MRTNREGFILVAALWLLVALGAVGLNAALRSKARRIPAGHLIDETRARQAAFAGGDYVRSRLTAALRARELELRSETAQRATSSGRLAVGATIRTANFAADQANNPWRDPAQLIESGLALDDLQFVLDVRDAGAALNINIATEQMLRQFLGQGIGLDYPTADAITQAILDWRDEDELPRVNSGERQEYIDAGAAVLPANRRFADVDELRHVMGMTPELLDSIRPYLTVIGSGRINVNAAPVEVLCALPGFRPAHWAQLIRLRTAGRYPGSAAELRRMLGVPAPPPPPPPRNGQQGQQQNPQQEFDRRVSYTTSEVVIVSEGRIENSPVRARVTTVVAQAPTGAAVTWQKVE